MTCKNCGAQIDQGSVQCSNCGAYIENEYNYVLMAENSTGNTYYSSNKKRKNSMFKTLIAIILTAVIVLGGEYYYFNVYSKKNTQPDLTFSYGCGVINGDEKVVYVALPENSRIEFINGVSLYDYDKTQSNDDKKAVSTDYEYTKSINGVFRTIFFDLADLNIEDNIDCTYTFEMIFSFYDDSNQYLYSQSVNFNTSASEDVSDIIFDHSMKTEETSDETTTQNETTTHPTTQQTTTKVNIDPSFLYTNFWYSEPFQDEDTYVIDAYKFYKNGNCTVTSYTKKGNADWIVKNTNTTFTVDGEILSIKNDGDYIISSNNTVSTMTERKYNSIPNAEDFFGI